MTSERRSDYYYYFFYIPACCFNFTPDIKLCDGKRSKSKVHEIKESQIKIAHEREDEEEKEEEEEKRQEMKAVSSQT